jgi:hypothetical protein
VLTTPASLTINGAEITSPVSAMRTPTDRPPASTISETSALMRTRPPAAAMTGRMVAAMRAAPPTGYAPPPK